MHFWWRREWCSWSTHTHTLSHTVWHRDVTQWWGCHQRLLPSRQTGRCQRMVAACEGLRVANFFALTFPPHLRFWYFDLLQHATQKSSEGLWPFQNWPFGKRFKLKASGNSPDLTSYNTVRCSMTRQFTRDIKCVVGVVGVVGVVQGLWHHFVWVWHFSIQSASSVSSAI